jgi:hypothetical protein
VEVVLWVEVQLLEDLFVFFELFLLCVVLLLWADLVDELVVLFDFCEEECFLVVVRAFLVLRASMRSA